MYYRSAQILSIIFHPLWMPLVIYLTVRTVDPFYIGSTAGDQFIFLLLGINIIAPAISMFIMMKYGMISSIDLHDRKERFWPYMLVIFYYVLSYTMLKWKGIHLPETVFSFFLSVVISLVVSMLINTFWKISVHMLAQGGVFGTLLGVNVIDPNMDILFPTLSLIMAGTTGFARLYLDAHTPGQVYAGFCLGTVVNFLIISTKFMI